MIVFRPEDFRLQFFVRIFSSADFRGNIFSSVNFCSALSLFASHLFRSFLRPCIFSSGLFSYMHFFAFFVCAYFSLLYFSADTFLVPYYVGAFFSSVLSVHSTHFHHLHLSFFVVFFCAVCTSHAFLSVQDRIRFTFRHREYCIRWNVIIFDICLEVPEPNQVERSYRNPAESSSEYQVEQRRSKSRTNPS